MKALTDPGIDAWENEGGAIGATSASPPPDCKPDSGWWERRKKQFREALIPAMELLGVGLGYAAPGQRIPTLEDITKPLGQYEELLDEWEDEDKRRDECDD